MELMRACNLALMANRLKRANQSTVYSQERASLRTRYVSTRWLAGALGAVGWHCQWTKLTQVGGLDARLLLVLQRISSAGTSERL